MEVKINREIRNYTESMFFGLSLRQFIFSVLAMGVAVLLSDSGSIRIIVAVKNRSQFLNYRFLTLCQPFLVTFKEIDMVIFIFFRMR